MYTLTSQNNEQLNKFASQNTDSCTFTRQNIEHKFASQNAQTGHRQVYVNQ